MVDRPTSASHRKICDFSEFDGKKIAAVFYAPERRVFFGNGSIEFDGKNGNLLRIKSETDVAEIIIHEAQWNGRILRGPRFGYDCDCCFVIGEPTIRPDDSRLENEATRRN